MIELSQTMSPPPPPEEPALIPGMLAAQEYLIAAGGLLSPGGDRPDFLQEAKDAIPIGQGQARCHYISYKVICMSLVGVINQGLSNPQIFQLLTNLYNSVYALQRAAQPANIAAAKNIRTIIAQGGQGAGADSLLTEAVSLLINLNSSISNLRAGNQAWNASIQYQYDPSHWWCAKSHREYWDETGQEKTIPAYFSDLIPGDFYLSSWDQVRLQLLGPLASFLPTVGVYSAKDRFGKPFMYSSNNVFPMPDQSNAYSSTIHFVSWI